MRSTSAALACFFCLLAPPAAGDTADRQVIATADVPSLIEILKANGGLPGDVTLGIAARERLAEIGRADPEAVVPAILAELAAPRAQDRMAQQARIALIGVLSDMGPAAEAAVGTLDEIVNDPGERNEWVGFQAGMALAAIGTPAAEMAHRRASERTVAGWAAGAGDDESLQAAEEQAYFIRQELRASEPDGRMIETAAATLRSLGATGETVVPSLLDAYGDPRVGDALRRDIAATLAALGVADAALAAERRAAEPAPDRLAAVIADTRSPHDLVRGLALMELGRLGPDDAVIDALVAALSEGRDPAAAALELGRFGAPAARALPALLPWVTDETAGANAIQAVGEIGVADPAAVVALRAIVATAGARHRGIAAAALGRLAAPESVPDLAAALAADEKYTRILAANALGAIGAEAADALPGLARLLGEPDAEVRIAALGALGRIGPGAARATPMIARSLQATDPRELEAAVAALEAIGGPEAERALAGNTARYARADMLEYQRLRGAGDRVALRRRLADLPTARRLALAERMAADQDPEIVHLAAAVFAEAGRVEAAATPVARIIGASDSGLETAFGLTRALAQRGSPGEQERFVDALTERLAADLPSAPPAERTRIRRALEALGRSDH